MKNEKSGSKPVVIFPLPSDYQDFLLNRLAIYVFSEIEYERYHLSKALFLAGTIS